MIPGKHLAEVISADFRFAQTGTPGIHVMFRLVNDGDETIPHDIWLSDGAIKMARAQLKALGYNPDDRTLEDIANDSKLLEGARAEIVVENEEFKGRSRLKVKFVNKIGSGKVTPELLKELDRKLREAKSKDEREEDPLPEPPF